MKKIFLFLLILVSISAISQNPTNYYYRPVRERMIAIMFDSSLHIPRYCGTPSGLRVGSSVHDGALAVDTCNNILYYYSSATWYAVTGENFANTNLTLTGNRSHNGYYYDADIHNLKSWATYTGTSGKFSFIYHDSTNIVLESKKSAASRSYLQVFPDSIFFAPNAGQVNIDSLRTQYGDTTTWKPVVWSPDNKGLKKFNSWGEIGLGGGGTPGGSNKQVQYNNLSAFGGYTGFEVGNTNNDVLITAGATTSVPLNIKLASSQTAHAFDISSSAGTGDLSYFTKDGYLKVPAGTSSVPSIQVGSTTTGLYEETSASAGIGIYNSGTGRAVLGQYGLFIRDGSTGSIDMGNNVLLGGTNYWRLSAPAVGTFQLGMESAQQSMIFKGKDNAGTNAAGFNMTIQPGAGTGTSTSAGNVVIQTPDAHGSDAVVQSYTSKFAINKNGSLRAYLYGDGTFTGTATQYLAVDTDGNLIEKSVTKSKGLTIEFPSASESIGMWKTPVAITVSSLEAVLVGSSTPSVTFNIAFGTDRTSGTNVFSSGRTATSTTTGHTFNSSFNDATIPAGSFIWVTTSAQSGTVTNIELTINYTED